MPRVPTNNRRIQRHYSPLLYRTRFSPERLLSHPPTICRLTFPLAEPQATPPPAEHYSHLAVDSTDSGDEMESEGGYPVKIPKPKGEVARPKRHGYSLRNVVGWDDKTYNRVQVCVPSNTLIHTCDNFRLYRHTLMT
jgi:hypothetical protein